MKGGGGGVDVLYAYIYTVSLEHIIRIIRIAVSGLRYNPDIIDIIR